MSAEKVLKSSPGMLPLFARAGAAMVPGSGRLPAVGGGRRNEVPELTLVLEDVSVDRATYDRVCRFPLRDALPATYPHMLAFPLQLSLMTDPRFPFPPLGLVHIANRIEQHRPIDAAEQVRLKVWATPLDPGEPRSRCARRRGSARSWRGRSARRTSGGAGPRAAAPPLVSGPQTKSCR